MGERSVVVVGYPGAELLDIACVTSTLDVTNRFGVRPAYRVTVVSPGGKPIECQSGLALAAQGTLELVRPPVDTLIVSGGLGYAQAAADPNLVEHVRRLAGRSRRVASVCTGALVLAATGLLDGRTATTHWLWADRMAHQFPAVRVDPAPIFIRDGRVSTAAGVTSALDLTLAFVAEDHGAELARRVSRALVTYLQRPGDQAQMSMFVIAPAPGHDLVGAVVDRIAGRLDAELDVATLAAEAGVSERHLARLFVTHLGEAPGRYVRRVRIEAAAQLLATTDLPLARVAARCGFRSAESLRQAFIARYGVAPSDYRTARAAG